MIIPAYKEDSIILQKIEDSLKLDYQDFEIIVVCEEMEAATLEKLKNISDPKLTVIHSANRMGKSMALNKGVLAAKYEIVFFSDANTMNDPQVLKKLIRNFNDPDVGGVCGRKSVIENRDREAATGDSFYWKLESFLKTCESKLHSIPTADGEIFAVRKSLYKPLGQEIINDDQAITIDLIKKGKRVIYEPEAKCKEEASKSITEDFSVKTRMIFGGLQIISKNWRFLNPLTGLFALQFFIHKTVRYFLWFFLLGIYISNGLILDNGDFYTLFFFLQNLFYLFAAIGFYQNKKGIQMFLFYFPFYFTIMNFAGFIGFKNFVFRRSGKVIWKKVIR